MQYSISGFFIIVFISIAFAWVLVMDRHGREFYLLIKRGSEAKLSPGQKIRIPGVFRR